MKGNVCFDISQTDPRRREQRWQSGFLHSIGNPQGIEPTFNKTNLFKETLTYHEETGKSSPVLRYHRTILHMDDQCLRKTFTEWAKDKMSFFNEFGGVKNEQMSSFYYNKAQIEHTMSSLYYIGDKKNDRRSFFDPYEGLEKGRRRSFCVLGGSKNSPMSFFRFFPFQRRSTMRFFYLMKTFSKQRRTAED